MATSPVATGKTLKEDSELFFAVTLGFAIPGASYKYQEPSVFNQLVRSRLRQRNRYNHDHHDTCVYIERSKNANVVAYTANLVDAETGLPVASGVGRRCALLRDDPIHAYFVNLEPSYVEGRRRKGIEYDCDDLNILERTMAYGCTASPVSTKHVLRFWGKQTPAAVAELLAQLTVAGAADASHGPQNGEEVSGGQTPPTTTATGSARPPLTTEALDSALRVWWGAFNPFLAHFVAISTWPVLMLCLPPLSTRTSRVTSQRGSAVRSVRSSVTAEAAPPVAQSLVDHAADPAGANVAFPADETKKTYGRHVEPAASTATSGILAEEDTVVVVIASIGDELSVVERVYVKSIEPKHFYQLPKVEYIEVFGVSLATGEPTYEKKLFRDFVWEPCSPSVKQPHDLHIRQHSNVEFGEAGFPPLDTAAAFVHRLNRLLRSRLVARQRFNEDHHDTCVYIERSKNENVVAYQANLVDSATGAAVESGATNRDCSFKATDPLHAYWIKINAEHVARHRSRGNTNDKCELSMVERKLAYGCNATLLSKEKFVSEALSDMDSSYAVAGAAREVAELLHSEMQPCQCRFVAIPSWSVMMLRLRCLPDGEETVSGLAQRTLSEGLSPTSSYDGAPRVTSDVLSATTDSNGAFPNSDTVVVMVASIGGELSVVQKAYVCSVEPKRFYQLPRVEYIEVFGTALATGKPTRERRTA